MASSDYRLARVLIVDDNPSDVMLIKLAMKAAGLVFEAHVVGDGDAAITYLCRPEARQTTAAPDLIVLDLNLPKRHGTEVLQAIRGGDCPFTAPVVILSSSPEDVIEELVHAANVEADCYLTKPPNLSEFLALGQTIRECFEARRRALDRAAGP